MVKYVKALTDIDVEISHEVFSTNTFPLIFPVSFSYGYNLKQFTFIIKILNIGGVANNKFPLEFPVIFFDAAIDDAIKNKLNNVLRKIMPVYCDWYFIK